jgi:deoxyhypusine synthase
MDEIKDFKWKHGMKVSELVEQYKYLGYQAMNLAKAAEIIKKMRKDKAKIFLSFTSNMVSSGLRGLFAQLIKLQLVDVVVTTVGSVEEDFIKAKKGKFFAGSFDVDDLELGRKGINRIGNIFVPNETYGKFETEFAPVLEKLYTEKKVWNATDLIKSMGKYVDDEDSILFQATRNNIPIYCPAITDGAMGLQFYFFKQKHKDFVVDVTEDMEKMMMETLDADKNGSQKTGAIILGGGVAKHHVILANLLRGGMDYAVYITTARDIAGSLSGATTSEAKSWGKIKSDADHVTVNGDVSVVFPFVVCGVLDE